MSVRSLKGIAGHNGALSIVRVVQAGVSQVISVVMNLGPRVKGESLSVTERCYHGTRIRYSKWEKFRSRVATVLPRLGAAWRG